MMHAYSESYRNDAQSCLAYCFDYLMNDCGMEADWVASLFLVSGYAEQFERGNPAVLAGLSGIELASAIVRKSYQQKELPNYLHKDGYTPEYWAGWALAQYQWYSALRFKDIFIRVPLSQIVQMYSVYHEMDITQFFDTMNQWCSSELEESKLKVLRENRGMSQSELSRESGVSLRSIQMYEQRVNDIDKAQAHTIYKLSRVIGCEMEDLLERPMK